MRERQLQSNLTPRQIEALTLIVGGLGRQEAAQEMGITERVLDNHISAVRGQLQIPSRLIDVSGLQVLAERSLSLGLVDEGAVSPYVLEGLQPKYKPVLELVALGKTNKEIATELIMEIDTSAQCVSDLYNFFSVDGLKENSRLILISKARRRGFIKINYLTIEEGIRTGRLINENYLCLVLLAEGRTFNEISDALSMEQRILWRRMYQLTSKLGVDTWEKWEDRAIFRAKQLGLLPNDDDLVLPSLHTGESLTGLEIALLHCAYTRSSGREEKLDVRSITDDISATVVEGILWKACYRLGLDPRKPYVWLSAAEKMYAQRGKSRNFCERVAYKYGVLNGHKESTRER